MPPATPLFSVVIAAYNAEPTVAAAVGAALGQAAVELEVIVVDDGSTDRTAAVVRRISDPRVRLLVEPNRGPAAARNVGIGASRGGYVAFLDSDDLWLPRYLERAGAALGRAERPGLAYTDAYAFEAGSGRVRLQTAMERMQPPIPPPADSHGFLLELIRRNFVFVSTVVPREVLDDVGGYDESLRGTADYELWLRIVSAGYNPVWIPGQQALYRLHRGQMHKDLLGMCTDLLATYSKLNPASMPSDAHRELLAHRRLQVERQLRAIRGQDRLPWALLRLRLRAVDAKQRLGLGDSWREQPPAEVAAAFPDLASV